MAVAPMADATHANVGPPTSPLISPLFRTGIMPLIQHVQNSAAQNLRKIIWAGDHAKRFCPPPA
jgi:hypothetical protein